MNRLVIGLSLLIATIGVAGRHNPAPAEDAAKLSRYEFTQVLMGISFKILLYADSESTANRASQAAFARIHSLDAAMSDYKPDSELSGLNRLAPTKQGVAVSKDLWHVLNKSQALAQQTDGAFDITVGPYVRLWRRARRRKELPSQKKLATAGESVGHDLLQLNKERQTAQLIKKGMRLDLGGIAKGYAADEALKALKDNGVNRALIDAGGDLSIGEAPPEKRGWRIEIATLKKPNENSGSKKKHYLLANQAVATSGDLWQYIEIDGKRYSHIINPKTGLGLTKRNSVTVIASNGLTADSLASALSVLGPEVGLELIESIAGTEALIVNLNKEGETQRHPTSGFPKSICTADSVSP